MFKRLFMLGAILPISAMIAVACTGAGASSSCASTLDASVFAAAQNAANNIILTRGGGGSSGGSHSSPPSNSGNHVSSGSSSGTHSAPPSNSGTHTGGPSAGSTQHNTVNAPSSVSPKSSYSAPRNSTIVIHGTSYPTSFGRSWTSSNGHVYLIHSHSYYHIGGYHDPLDPYDWTNFTNPLSPYYGIHLNCG